MGVPRLFPFIKEKFPNAITHFHKNSHRKYSFDYIYLDSNPLLHGASQTVYNYGAKKRFLNSYDSLSEQEKLAKVFELFFENIIEIISIIIPQKVLIIALDGPAPRAKMAQQRQRRFIAARDPDNKGFSSTSMTPGTEFMHELSKFMYWRIRKYLEDHKNIEIIFSSTNVPGEGEHKLMDYIRSLPQVEKMNAKHCMFGPDADLIMLELSLNVKFMSLFREDQNEPEQYYLLNAHYIRQGLVSQLGQTKGLQSGKRTIYDVSNDFVFMGFFVGNDFLPKIKMFYKLDDGLEKMFLTYGVTSMQGTRNYLTQGKYLLIEGLQNFIFYLSRYERQYIASQATIISNDPRFIDHTLLEHAKVSTVTQIGYNNAMEEIQLISEFDMKGYRTSYYKKAGINSQEEINIMCREYLRNLGWVYQYYTIGLPSWGDFYAYHYAPLMEDLKEFVNNINQQQLNELLTFEKGQPALPFEQLLSVLPASLSYLLPEEYRTLMTSPDSPLIGYYPDNFEVDYEGKFKEYQGIAILPFVNYEIVSKAFKDVQTNNLYHKNILGSEYTFKWSAAKNVIFKSEYGVINNCKIDVKQK
jgi:5'-3' exoribonuclease 1